MKQTATSHGHRPRAVAAVLAGALVLAACGGGGDGDAFVGKQDADATPGLEESPGGIDEGHEKGDQPVDQPLESGEAVSFLPFDAAAPSGHRTVTDACGSNEGPLDDENPWLNHRSPATYAVPADWGNIETSSGGSDVLVGNDVRMRFRTDSGDKVDVGYEWDIRNMDGEITDYNNDPWTTFDYDSSRGDSSATIEYESVETVSIGDQEVELFYRDPSQAPDHVDGEEYKARVKVMEVTNPDPNSNGIDIESFVVTISFDSDATDMTPALVESIISSISIPTCEWDEELLRQEALRSIDLNGDGEFKSQEEVRAEQSEQFDEMQAELEAELEAESEEG